MASSTRVVIFLLLASIAVTGTQAGLSCFSVGEILFPCVVYVAQGGRGPVPGDCCYYMKKLKELDKSVSDRKYDCNCIKSTFAHVPSHYFPIISSLQPRCHVDLTYNYKADGSMDCNSIH